MRSSISRSLICGLVSIFITTSTVVRAHVVGVHSKSQPINTSQKAETPPIEASKFDAIPMVFEPNVGQTNSRVRFVARGRGYTTFVTDETVVLKVGPREESLRMTFPGARKPRLGASGQLASRSNYFVGLREAWRTDVPNYAAVQMFDVHEGIALRLHGTDQHLEYDFELAPGADPSQVRVRFEGATHIEQSPNGDLILHTRDGELRQQRPIAYQQSNKRVEAVSARFVVEPGGALQLQLGAYDTSRPLVVDPVLVYATAIGGGDSIDEGRAVAVDTQGAAYVLGTTFSTNFPTTPGAWQTTNPTSRRSIFVTKLAPSGGSIVYSTYFPEAGFAESIAVDSAGAVYLTGSPATSAFPVTPGAYDTTYDNAPYFVTKLAPSGASLVYSTYLGRQSGPFVVPRIAVDAGGSAYVCGTAYASTDEVGPFYPTTPGAFDTTNDATFKACLTKISADGSALVYSTFLGGPSSFFSDFNPFLAVDSQGRATISGTTRNMNFPVTEGAFDTVLDGQTDIFITRFSADGSTLVYSSFLGGSDVDVIAGLALDPAGDAFVASTTASQDFPTTSGAFLETRPSGSNALAVTRIDTTGTSLVYSTYFGADFTWGEIAVDSASACYLVGSTFLGGPPENPPTTPSAFQPNPSETFGSEGFVAKLAPSGGSLIYASYLGGPSGTGNYIFEGCTGVAVDAQAAAYVVGTTDSPLFPTVAGLTAPRDRINAFITKISPSGASLTYSSQLGGDTSLYARTVGEQATAVAIASDGAPIIVGTTGSLNFPTTPGSVSNGFTGDQSNAFVTKLSSGGSAVIFSTFLGGAGANEALDIALGPSGSLYVCGRTTSNDFPVSPGAVDTSHTNEDLEGFVSVISATGSTLLASTYLGGIGHDSAEAISVDALGAAYVVGNTESSDFPVTTGAFSIAANGGGDAFVSKLNASVTSLAYSTYIGGLEGDGATDVAVDGTGQATVVGSTASPGFPTTLGALDRTLNGNTDAFITRIMPTGSSLVFSTFIGGEGSDTSSRVAIDASNTIYLTGSTRSFTFPVTPGAFDETLNFTGCVDCAPSDAFVAKINSSGTSLTFATYLGGSGNDEATGIAVDGAGQVVVCGTTSNQTFPVTPGAYDTTYNGSVDCFASKLDSSGAVLSDSTFLGGSDEDRAYGMALDAAGAVYIAGATASGEFPTRAIGVRDASSAFVAKLGATIGLADLAVSNQESVDPAPIGTSVSYTITVRNDGPAIAPGVVATSSVGSGMAFASCAVSQGTFTTPSVGGQGVVTASIGTLAANQSATVTVTIVVTAASGAVLVNTASATSLASDPDPSDNTAAESTGVIATARPGTDTPGVTVASTSAWFLRNSSAPGPADEVFGYGPPASGWIFLRGDWNGDGIDTPGLYAAMTGAFFLKNSNGAGPADIVFTYGPGGEGIVPLVGDWDGDGVDTIGIYVRATAAFFLRNTNGSGSADTIFTFGPGSGSPVPLAGDWDGDGDDTIGIYVPTSGVFFLKNANAPGPADTAFAYGPPDLVPLAGDWDNNGADSVGVYVPSTAAWFLRNANTPGPADLQFTFGPSGATPLTGDWDGH